MTAAAARIRVPVRNRITTAEQAADAIARLAEIRADIGAQAEAFERHVAELKRALDAPKSLLDAEAASIVADLQNWAETNRATLTKGGKLKSFRIGVGRLGWRKRPAKVVLTESEGLILDMLRQLGFHDFIRVKETINKEAMLDRPEVAATVAGVSIEEGESDFIVETKVAS
jgi:phage host-nuclease inhibitor protein Gam